MFACALLLTLDRLVYACFMYWFWCPFLFWIVKCFEPVKLDWALYKNYVLLLLYPSPTTPPPTPNLPPILKVLDLMRKLRNEWWRRRGEGGGSDRLFIPDDHAAGGCTPCFLFKLRYGWVPFDSFSPHSWRALFPVGKVVSLAICWGAPLTDCLWP